MSTPTAILTTAQAPWQSMPAPRPVPVPERPDLRITDREGATWRGFGGCFNELGWIALGHLPEAQRTAVLDQLFSPGVGLGLTYNRLPVGANDYSVDWYSYDEVAGDHDLAHFSIARDRKHLLPYLKQGLARAPGMTLFASPWSPPTWLKTPAVYNYGTLNADDRTYQTYANYFVKYLQAYAAEGVTIHHLHPQNEPISSQKFPSCVVTGPEFVRFIGRFLGPTFERAGLSTEIWLGTLNGPPTDDRRWWTTYHHYAGYILQDADAARYIKGVAYQWDGKYALQQTRQAHPDLPVIQSENECGDGTNEWRHAWYVCDQVQHYLGNDAVAYVYWNMVLEPKGHSTWGWQQNSLFTVDPATRTVTTNPEYHILRHYAAIRPGDRRLVCERPWSASCLAYRGADGVVAVLRNPFPDARTMTVAHGNQAWAVDLPGQSIATVRLG